MCVSCGVPSNSACCSSTPPVLTGPTSQEIIREAVHPYLDDVLIATKAGLTRNGPDVIKQGNELAHLGPRVYNLADRSSAGVLGYCTQNGIGFIPWTPVNAGQLARPGGPVDHIAAARDSTPSKVALSWLLHRSDVILPIPGTSNVAHLEKNVSASRLRLSEAELVELDAAA